METYRVVVRGHIEAKRFRPLSGLLVNHGSDGNTEIIAKLEDQAALHSLLSRIRDLGLALLLVDCMFMNKE